MSFAQPTIFHAQGPKEEDQPQNSIQVNQEDIEMENLRDQLEAPSNDSYSLANVMNAHRLSSLFQQRAYNVNNVGQLKKAYAYHLKEARKIKKILRKLAERIQASSDSDEDEYSPSYEAIEVRALRESFKAQMKFQK